MSGRARWELPNRAPIVRRSPRLPRGADPGTVEALGRPPNPQRGDPVGERVRSPKQSRKAERNQVGAPRGAEPLSRVVRRRGQGNEPSEAPACAQVGGDCPVSPPGRPREERHRSLREGSTSRPVAREDGSLSVSERSAARRQDQASFAEEAPGDPELQPAPREDGPARAALARKVACGDGRVGAVPACHATGQEPGACVLEFPQPQVSNLIFSTPWVGRHSLRVRPSAPECKWGNVWKKSGAPFCLWLFRVCFPADGQGRVRRVEMGALVCVVTPQLVGPLLHTSQIKSRWSLQGELGVQALGSALQSWVVGGEGSPFWGP